MGDHDVDATRSAALFARARELIPGGVNSPVRAFNAVGGTPRFVDRGEGACLWDVDGNEYIDYVMSWGPLINGHAYRPVVEAVARAAALGTSFGAPTELELLLAERVVSALPAVEMVRFVNSGTEAAMSAIRLARARTGRDLIVKFGGNYHGHADMLLVAAGSGSLTFGVPSSPGVPAGAASQTLVAPYNDAAALDDLFARHDEEIAAVIVEPVAGNMGVVLPAPGFLHHLRTVTRRHGALLIADEVITGFRVGAAGAQGRFPELDPDLTVLGKIIGGGLPVGAYGGRREVMEEISPSGPVYQAGTLSGNPLAMAAGLANLAPLDAAFYVALERTTEHLATGLRAAAQDANIPVRVNAACGLLTVFFTAGPVDSLAAAQASDTVAYARFFHAMLDRGIYLPPSQFEAWMPSAAHSEEQIDRTLAAAADAFDAVQ